MRDWNIFWKSLSKPIQYIIIVSPFIFFIFLFGISIFKPKSNSDGLGNVPVEMQAPPNENINSDEYRFRREIIENEIAANENEIYELQSTLNYSELGDTTYYHRKSLIEALEQENRYLRRQLESKATSSERDLFDKSRQKPRLSEVLKEYDDLVHSPPSSDTTQKRSAVLGYSHPSIMKRNAVKHINAVIKIANSHQQIKDTLLQLIDAQNVFDANEDSFKVYTQNIIMYKLLDVTLIDPQGIFLVTPIHDSSLQEIDTINGNRWDWTITTKTENENGILILKVKAYPPNGSIVPFDDKQIPITIEIDKGSFFRKAIIYILDNPSMVIAAVILPALGFLIKRYVFQENKNNEKPPKKTSTIAVNRRRPKKPRSSPY